MVTSEWPESGAELSGLFVKRQAEFLRAAGVDVDVFHFRGRKNPIRYLRAWVGFRLKLRRRAYDLVHGQFGQAGLLALPKRLPLVMTFRGTDLSGIIIDPNGKQLHHGRLLGYVSRVMAGMADVVVVVSERMKQYIPYGKPTWVIPSGVDFEVFRPMSKLECRRYARLPLDEQLILFAGNPSMALKRFGLAQQAVEILNQTMPVRLVHAWGIPHTDMPHYLNACDALVLTSIDEGSPNIVKEALACNLPVVSVDVGDVAERISGIVGCELCADDRAETIAGSLFRVLKRGQRVNGREAVGSLDERILTHKLIQIYEQAVTAS
jgi:glycosyltransferase involved in cell wall biosynthesis